METDADSYLLGKPANPNSDTPHKLPHFGVYA